MSTIINKPYGQNSTTAGGTSGGTSAYPGIYAPGQYTVTSTSIIGTHTPVMTKEEQDELAVLEKEHTEKEKFARIDAFKMLHPDLRQRVVDYIFWKVEAAK